METITCSQLREHFAEYKRRTARGESFLITRYGRLIAKMVPYHEAAVPDAQPAAGINVAPRRRTGRRKDSR
jgi:antitoxin (DNA-binding transcriptional repressor) of toxin-antitoxin stability system